MAQHDPLEALRWRRRLASAEEKLAAGHVEAARDEYVALTNEQPEDAAVWHGLGLASALSGELQQAEEYLRRALSLNHQEHANWWNDLGEVLRLQQRLEEAVQAYQEGITRRPDFAEAHNNLGVAQTQLNNLEAAEASFLAAIAIDPDHAQACNNLGVLLENRERWEEALCCYERAVILKADFSEALDNYNDLLQRQPHWLEGSLQRMAAILEKSGEGKS